MTTTRRTCPGAPGERRPTERAAPAQTLPLALLALLAAAPGCFSSSPAPVMRYFRLPLWETVKRQPGPPLPAVIQVETLDVQPDYDHLRLVYRVSAEQLRHYRLRQWVVKPGRLLQGALQRLLEATGAFKVVTDTPRPIPTYVLRGRVYSLEQVETGKRGEVWHAAFELELTLHRATDNHVVWQMRAAERARVPERSPAVVVATLTSLLRQRLLREIPGMAKAVRADLASR